MNLHEQFGMDNQIAFKFLNLYMNINSKNKLTVSWLSNSHSSFF
jgi:hypothetical protein